MIHNLANDDECRHEAALRKVLGRNAQCQYVYVDRQPTARSREALSIRDSSEIISLDVQTMSQSERVLLIGNLIARASRNEITFVTDSEAEAGLHQVTTDIGLFTISVVSLNDDCIVRPCLAKPAFVKLPLAFVSSTKDFVKPLLMVGTRFFSFVVTGECPTTLSLLEEEMERSTLKICAVVGAMQVPIEELMRFRPGSSITLGQVNALEAIFEIEGRPYALGKIILKENGELVAEATQIL